MSDIGFFSSNSYIFLPTKKNPKVALAVDNANIARNAFKLYNPFSTKAKFLKIFFSLFYVNSNRIFKSIYVAKKERTAFIGFLEKELGQSLIVSLYFATINDKIVIQLQSSDAKIIGYIKYPLNQIGFKHIKNETEAFEILSKLNIIDRYILKKEYRSTPFILLKELEGDIGIVKDEYVGKILKMFERDEKYLLLSHPRIINLMNMLIQNNMKTYASKIEIICKKSQIKYKLVYEHGDFAPWNIIKTNKDYRPFDFEYFEKDGLEYFDIIKYYYQIGKLLEGKDNQELLDYIIKKVKIKEILYFMQLFLIKEILINKEEQKSYEFEENLIELVEKV